MNDVNWWLMALSFVLGLVLTAAFMIRRVKAEAPAVARTRDVDDKPDDVKPDDSPTTQMPLVATGSNKTDEPKADESKTAVIPLVGAAAATSSTSEKDEPYGAGSLRLAKGATPPSDYDVKGNEDSMLYHTKESPSYAQTVAEVWFRDEDSAQRAGFARWDSNQATSARTETMKLATAADVPAGPHGPGSAAPAADGSGPQGWTIKGNEDSMLYHTTRSPSYKRTIAEVWFRDEESAARAGFQPWDRNRRKNS